MKTWKVGAAALAALVINMGGQQAQAQAAWPTKPINMVVPYAAGGGIDAIARLVAQSMSETLGQPIVIENKGGGGGVIGATVVAKAAPDGYTILMAGNPELVINPTLMPGVQYNVARDFVPVMLVAESPNVIVAHPSVKATLKEIVGGAYRGGTLTIGTPGQGSPQHLTVEVMRSLGQADFVHVPYKGAGPAIKDVLGGQTALALTGAPPLLPHIRSGNLRALAVTQPSRSDLLPDIPTFEEASGFKGMETYSTWYGLLVPAGTPVSVVSALHKAAAATLERSDIRSRLREMGTEVVALPTEAFGERIGIELKRYESVIRRFQIKVD